MSHVFFVSNPRGSLNVNKNLICKYHAMKKLYLLLLLLTLGFSANAQKVQSIDFRQSQSRISEPNMEVFVKPLIVDLDVISETRVEDTWEFPTVDLTKLSDYQLQNLKATALFKSSKKYEADVIVAATFDITTEENNGGVGLSITVIGYPAQYKNWRPANDSSDYEWIEDVYGIAIGSKRTEATKAIK